MRGRTRAPLGVALLLALTPGCGPSDASDPAGRLPGPVTARVVHVIDGDTVVVDSGEHVRLVGIDTPEIGECGYGPATRNLIRLVGGREVTLTVSDEDEDRYGRLLRYVDVGDVDAGLAQIRAGLAVARYDSRDGYGHHPREDRYVAADRDSPDPHC